MACCRCGGRPTWAGPRWAKVEEPAGATEGQERGGGEGGEARGAEPAPADAGSAGPTARAEPERGCC